MVKTARQPYRAGQGHSIGVDLGYEQKQPPRELFHGTAERFGDAISREGWRKMNRDHVHLSADRETAVAVGSRHGRPIVFVVAAGKMHDAGYVFFLSANGVWLTDSVSRQFLIRET